MLLLRNSFTISYMTALSRQKSFITHSFLFLEDSGTKLLILFEAHLLIFISVNP